MLQTLDFHQVLAHAAGLQAILAFAASEYSDENVLFYIAVLRWRKECSGPGAVESPELRKQAAGIIDSYLCAAATRPVNLPSKVTAGFTQASSEHAYEFRGDMFELAEAEIVKLIRIDTFERFRLSDAAATLALEHPELIDMHAANAALDAAALKLKATLREILLNLATRVGCERVTAWIIDSSPDTKLWSVGSTDLGNSIISVPLGKARNAFCPRCPLAPASLPLLPARCPFTLHSAWPRPTRRVLRGRV